jgi:hypothetical protein
MIVPRWRKSSYTGNQGNCVEVAHTKDAVRDSKNPNGPVLHAEEFPSFLAMVQLGDFDRP